MVCFETPTGIDSTAEDSGIGARDIEENGIEGVVPIARGVGRPIELRGSGICYPHAVEIFC